MTLWRHGGTARPGQRGVRCPVSEHYQQLSRALMPVTGARDSWIGMALGGSEDCGEGSYRQTQQSAATDAGAVGEHVVEFHGASGRVVLAGFHE